MSLCSLNAENKAMEEGRRNARVQATYVIRLVNFIRWETNETIQEEPFKIVVLGDENNGFVESLRFLVAQSQISSNNYSIEVFHFPNSESQAAISMIEKGSQFIYFTKDSKLELGDVSPIRGTALLISEGRKFVSEQKGCIAFEQSRNRIKMIVNEKCFRRRFLKLSPVLSSLRSVVEVVDPI
ncbi:MAG: YfiR family protein [Opitutales bacterium]